MPAINRFLLAALLAFAMPALASAQSYTLNRFHASESPDDAFHVSRPDAMGHLNLGVQLHLDYANDPLVYELDDNYRPLAPGRYLDPEAAAAGAAAVASQGKK